MGDYVAQNELSILVSKDMKKRGFSFVGPVGIYAYLQAVGVINEHMAYCYKA
jgi:DNA-3-methyladenine glycosylase I